MRLVARAHKLMLAVERKDVVPDHVVLPVVLMKARAFAAIDDVILQREPVLPSSV